MEDQIEQAQQATPPPSSPIPLSSNKKRGIIFFFVIIALIGLSYFVFEKIRCSPGLDIGGKCYKGITVKPQSVQKISTPLTPDPTANWKTYTNTKVGFQMKYPNRYGPPTVPVSEPPIMYADGSEDNVSVIFGEGSTDFIHFSITPFTGSLDEFITFTTNPKTTFVLKERLKIDGVDAKRITDKEPNIQEIYFVSKAHGFHIYTNINYSEVELNQILSTFKFTDDEKMKGVYVPRCDLNVDGTCDNTDSSLFKKSLGKKRGDLNYNPLADADADGVVTTIDEQILFPKITPCPMDLKIKTPC